MIKRPRAAALQNGNPYAQEEGLIPREVISATVEGASPIKAWREYLGLTQAEVAARLHISQSAYAQIENATRPRKSTLIRVGKALGIGMEQLNF
jgi:DNA-binding XRE family transcriptional regulator